MTKPHPLVLSIAAFLCGTQSTFGYTAGGHSYDLTCNGSGYVLTSQYPVTRTVGQGVDTQSIQGIETLYLGRDCDAFHPTFGNGRWCWANGGFWAEFPAHNFAFARQELYCPQGDDAVGLNCGC